MEGGGKKREEEEVNNVAHWLVKSGKVQKHQKLRQKKTLQFKTISAALPLPILKETNDSPTGSQ